MNFWRAVAEKSTGTMFETPRPTTVNPASEAHAHGAATTSPNPAAAHRLPYRRTRASPSACTMRSPNRRPMAMATEKTRESQTCAGGFRTALGGHEQRAPVQNGALAQIHDETQHPDQEHDTARNHKQRGFALAPVGQGNAAPNAASSAIMNRQMTSMARCGAKNPSSRAMPPPRKCRPRCTGSGNRTSWPVLRPVPQRRPEWSGTRPSSRLRPRKGKGTRPSARRIPPRPVAEASPGR